MEGKRRGGITERKNGMEGDGNFQNSSGCGVVARETKAGLINYLSTYYLSREKKNPPPPKNQLKIQIRRRNDLSATKTPITTSLLYFPYLMRKTRRKEKKPSGLARVTNHP